MRDNQVFKKKYCIIIASILLLCMVIGSFYDYQLSMGLFNKESAFGIFFASYGQLPAMLCFAIGGTLLLRMIDKNKPIKRVLCYIFAVLLNVFAVLGITVDPMLYMKNMPLALSLGIAVIIVGIVDVWIYKSTKDTSKDQLSKFITLVISVMLIELIVVNIVKIPWGRPRMRLIADNAQATFQPWWVIGSNMKEQLMALGVAGEEFKSFPSGHTANATCAILLGCLPLIVTKLKGKEDLLFFIGVAFAFVVAFSRIIMGAHFLTDVTVGMSVAFLVEIVMVRLLWK